MEAKQVLKLIGLAPRVTCTEKYAAYRHSTLFLRTKYQTLPQDPADLPAMMGYKNSVKFVRRAERWLQGMGRIPCQFLESLGITREDLLTILEFDRQDFYEALKHARSPENFQYRLAPCIYPLVRLPQHGSDDYAIAYIRWFLKGQPAHVQQNGGWFSNDVKTVFVRENNVCVDYHEPAIIFEHGFITFKTQTIPGTVTVR